jgi:hypothetical protein
MFIKVGQFGWDKDWYWQEMKRGYRENIISI